ncbi:phage tail tip lysozyme [[Clostridium] symbiosum]|uniref:phage tail tip lysozyme n=1 Tax=Clostridium symbiosum TaxID=1512 RepID=UPI002054EB81|nr:MAG TPA: PGRP protein [Caudoviricetes sp.]
MKLVESILTKNPCYTAGRKITVKGLMLHSVGCPQPKASVFINSWNSASYDRACVHAFIDGNDATVYQTLPWNHRGWHGGGSSNNTHIGVEMCEPACIKYVGGSSFTCSDTTTAKAVAKRTYEASVELFAYLCKMYSLDPLGDGVIVSHREGHSRGIASNHGDPEHLWNQLGMGYTMTTFRNAVKAQLSADIKEETPAVTSNEETIWNYLYGKLGNAYGTAGLMGNLYTESALRPTNLQNTYEKKLDYSDAEYTAAVDNGSYDNFIKDSAGYGLAQWTYWSRKQALLEFAKAEGKSIGDLSLQLDFIWKELSESYSGLLSTLKTATSVRDASTAVLTIYERPADQGESVQTKRVSYGQAYYDKYAVVVYPEKLTTGYYRVRKSWDDKKSQLGAYRILANAKAKADANAGYSVFSNDGKVVYAPSAKVEKPESVFEPYLVKVSIEDLNIRKGPGTNYGRSGYTGKGCFTIVEEADGVGASKWGLLKSYKDKRNGWISLDYAKRI